MYIFKSVRPVVQVTRDFAIYYLAIAYCRLQEYITARRYIEALLKLEPNNRQAFKLCKEHVNDYEFIWLQFYIDKQEEEEGQQLKKITKYLFKLYKQLRENSILIGLLPGAPLGRCFIRMKDDEKFQPIVIDGTQYPCDLKLKK